MGALLSALAKNPRASWARAAAVGVVAAILAIAMLKSHQAMIRHRQLCQRAGLKWVGVWDEEAKRRIEQAFLSAKQSYARTAWQTVERALDAYAREWAALRADACEATYVRAERSAAVFDWEALCLEQRLSEAKALTALFARPDAQVLQGAVKAVQALKSPRVCSDQATGSKLKAPDDPSLRAQVEDVRDRIAEATAFSAAAKYARAAEVAKAAVNDAERLGYKPLRAEALYALAQIEAKRGEAASAQAAVEDAIIAGEAGSHDEVAAKAWILLVSVIGQQGRAEEAQRLARFAGAAVERLGPGHPLEGELHHVLASVFAAQNEGAQSLASLERALAISQRWRGAEDPLLADALQALGIAHARLGEDAKAFEAHQWALRIREKSLGADHPEVAVSLSELGTLSARLGRLEEALSAHERALSIRQAVFGEDHPQVAASLSQLASTNARLGRDAQARSCYERAIGIYENVFGPQHPDLIAVLDDLGTSLLSAGEHDRAVSLFKRALWINETLHGVDHLLNAALLAKMGKARIEQREPAEAIALLERAVAIGESRGAERTDLAAARFELARALWESGKRNRERAMRLALQARDAYELVEARASELADVDDWLALRGWPRQKMASMHSARAPE